jgi:hypothetical protein
MVSMRPLPVGRVAAACAAAVGAADRVAGGAELAQIVEQATAQHRLGDDGDELTFGGRHVSPFAMA